MTSTALNLDVAVDAEQSVIGALLIDNGAYFRVCGSLNAGDFYHREHKLAFNAIKSLCEANQPADLLTVSEKLEKSGEMEAVGGMSYLGSIANNTPSSANVVAYAKIVKERSQRRNARLSLHNALAALDDPESPLETVVTSCMAGLQDLSTSGRSDKSFSDAIDEAQASAKFAMERRKAGGILGVSTTLPTFDRLIGGFHGPKLIVIGGRPGTYKSALGWQILLRAAKQQIPGGMISLEMDASEFAGRAIASELKIDGHAYTSGDAYTVNNTKIPDSLRKYPIRFDDGAFQLGQVMARIIEWKHRYKIQIACVDYLQLVEHAGSKGRLEEVSAISRQLKLLAKRLGIPIIAIAQLSRESEKQNRRPVLSDLRESGSIEQDADIVIFNHCIPGNEQEKDRFESILAKQRGGPARRLINLEINGPHFRVGEQINAPTNYL